MVSLVAKKGQLDFILAREDEGIGRAARGLCEGRENPVRQYAASEVAREYCAQQLEDAKSDNGFYDSFEKSNSAFEQPQDR